MKGESAFGFVKAIVLLAVVSFVAYIVYKIYDALKKIPEGTVKVGELIQETIGDVVTSVNPVNPDNVVNKVFNKVVRSDRDPRSLGSRAYDWFNSAKMDAIRADTPFPKPVKKSVFVFDHLSEDVDQGVFDAALLRDEA